MDVQRKEDICEKGKSMSDIGYELASMIMGRIILKIDSDDCHSSHLKVNNLKYIIFYFYLYKNNL